jgi:hypothetical protein
MFGTLILDVFAASEAREVRDALEELLGPRSASAWSSGGVYVFWDPDTREPLYVGIAGDLPVRFAEHLALRAAAAEDCKRDQIASYFAAGHEQLGYTVFTMPSLSPTSTSRQRASLGLTERHLIDLNEALSAEAVEATRGLEGLLIAANQAAFGRMPPWNVSRGRVPARPPPPDNATLRFAVGVGDILLQARRTIRELAADDLAAMFEAHLHGVRMLAVRPAGSADPIDNVTIRRDLAAFPSSFEIGDQILRSGYLDRRCPVTIGPSAEPAAAEAARESGSSRPI